MADSHTTIYRSYPQYELGSIRNHPCLIDVGHTLTIHLNSPNTIEYTGSKYVPPHLRNQAGGGQQSASSDSSGGPPSSGGRGGGYDRRSYSSGGRGGGGSFNQGYGRGGGDQRSFSQGSGGGQVQQNSRWNDSGGGSSYGGDRRGTCARNGEKSMNCVVENVLLMIIPISSHSSVYFRLFFYKDLDTGEVDMEGDMAVELPVAMR